MRTITSAATFTVASQPSTSWVGSVSAIPISCACLSDCSKLRPCSMPVRVTLVVELRIPRKPRRWSTGRVSKREKMGAPSITVDSKRKRRCLDAARARSEEHTSELQSHVNLVCRLLLEKKKKNLLDI